MPSHRYLLFQFWSRIRHSTTSQTTPFLITVRLDIYSQAYTLAEQLAALSLTCIVVIVHDYEVTRGGDAWTGLPTRRWVCVCTV